MAEQHAQAIPLTPFYQIAHELSHSPGTIDMYNTGAGNNLLTLMGACPFFTDDRGTVHLDIWHKLVLGWAEPRVFSMHPRNSAIVLWPKNIRGFRTRLFENNAPLGPILSFAFARAFSTIAGVTSSPITWRRLPISSAATQTSAPPRQPRSTTVSPGWIGARPACRRGFPYGGGQAIQSARGARTRFNRNARVKDFRN
jgi:hypothetical protein